MAAAIDEALGHAASFVAGTIGCDDSVARTAIRSIAVAVPVYCLYKFLAKDHQQGESSSTSRDVQQHIERVSKKYSYMMGHVQHEYFADHSLALKIPRNGVVVDVGAHFGLFSMQCHINSGFTSKHFCFEPIPQIRAICESTLGGLDPSKSRMKIYPYGLSDQAGEFEFTYVAACPELSGYSNVDFEIGVNLATATQVDRYYHPDCPPYFRGIVPGWFWYLPRFIGAPLLAMIYDKVMAGRPKSEKVHCKVKRLSDVLSSEDVGPKIDVLKIDVEGAEVDVLNGISQDDWAKIQMVVIEVHDKNGHLAIVKNILSEHGLTNIIEEQDHITKPLEIWQVLATRP